MVNYSGPYEFESTNEYYQRAQSAISALPAAGRMKNESDDTVTYAVWPADDATADELGEQLEAFAGGDQPFDLTVSKAKGFYFVGVLERQSVITG